MKSKDLPLYSQLPNACGLSTFLMLIDPEKNLEYKILLIELFEALSFNKKYEKEEFEWSFSVSYILLKCIGNNILKDFLRKKNNVLIKYYIPILLHKLKKPTLPTSNFITPKILHSFVQTMRTDADLKLLFYLFGGSFYPQQQKYPDGTGSLYFIPKDFKNNKMGYKKKIKLMQNHLCVNRNEKIPVLALNKGYHWVAINSIISENVIILHDPLMGKYAWEIKGIIPDHYRFYFFDHDPEKAFILKKKVRQFLFSEINNE
ncbi:MAG: hypothetical protein ACTSXH_10440 [Promethearchaeota archaeon]